MKARVRIAQGDLDAAADWARRPRAVGDATCASSTTSRWRGSCIAQRDDDAIGLLDRLLDPARASGREASVLEIRMLQALAHDAQGQRSLALETLDAALAAAPEPEGFVRLFLDEGAPMTSLLRDAPRGRSLAKADRPVVSGTAEPLSERELQVLRLLDTELSGPEIAAPSCSSRSTRCAPTRSTSSPSSTSPAAAPRSAAPATTASSKSPRRNHIVW